MCEDAAAVRMLLRIRCHFGCPFWLCAGGTPSGRYLLLGPGKGGEGGGRGQKLSGPEAWSLQNSRLCMAIRNMARGCQALRTCHRRVCWAATAKLRRRGRGLRQLASCLQGIHESAAALPGVPPVTDDLAQLRRLCRVAQHTQHTVAAHREPAAAVLFPSQLSTGSGKCLSSSGIADADFRGPTYHIYEWSSMMSSLRVVLVAPMRRVIWPGLRVCCTRKESTHISSTP
jgi:hypothetical protein